mgnify:CR=1 FL=1
MVLANDVVGFQPIVMVLVISQLVMRIANNTNNTKELGKHSLSSLL